MEQDRRAVTFLEEFVRISSPSGQEAGAARFLVNQMRALGWEARIDEVGNAVGEVDGSGPLVALLGHIDTVPGEVPIRISDNNLYGRGTVDAKGPFATFVQATALSQQRGTLRCRVLLLGAVEEETATSRGAHFAVTQYQPDFCIIGEPSSWDRVTLGYKGRLLIHYQHQQPAAHSAGAAPAAPEQLVAYWLAVQQHCASFNQERPRLFDQLMPALRQVESGGDGLVDWAAATIGLRLPEDIDPHDLAHTLRGLLDTLPASSGDTSLTFEGACPAFRSPRTTPLASAFVRAIRAHGGKPGFVHKTGTSDMNVAGPAWQCPIVAYGPGDSRLDHSPDEHLSLDEYQQAIHVLADVLSGLA